MCGFLGIISKQHQTIAQQFGRCSIDIAARGVSLETHIAQHEAYAYSRLATDAVADTRLAAITPSEGTRLLFNGLITNVGFLVSRYQLSNETAASDRLCLHEGLRLYGPSFLKHCRGMFAFAFIDEHTIMLARDTVGIKPLYYVQSHTVFAFASEIKGLRHLQLPVHEVQPGQIVHFDRRTHLTSTSSYAYESEATGATLEQQLCASVVEPTQRYMAQTTKSVGLMLSGGLDSAIIAQLLMTHLEPHFRNRLVAFCVGTPDAPDVRIARRLAEHLGLRLEHVVPYTDVEAFQHLPTIIFDTESPHARVAKVALLYDAVAAAIRRHGIDVVLGGEGADELFYGYHRFIDGYTDRQSATLFGLFFTKVFPATLLQRYDRIMARNQIEGRVPFLDQEIIALASQVPASAKVQRHAEGHTSKLPLREIAQSLGLPPYIYNRPKLKMTEGATGQQNTTASDGYLEQATWQRTHIPLKKLVERIYMEYFSLNGHDILVQPTDAHTEESIMALAATMGRRTNKQTQGVTS